MRVPSRETVERIRGGIPCGTRVELDPHGRRPGPAARNHWQGAGVDDTGSLLMRWSNGSGLNVVYGEDIVRKV